MVARGAIPGLIFLAGCQSSTGAGFQVVNSVPADGADGVVEALEPELRLNAKADPATCSKDYLVLAPVDEEGLVLFSLDYQLEFTDEGMGDKGMKVIFHTELSLPRGYGYALFVRPSEEGCLDIDGRALEPFGAEFFVP
jgi:hypothetical protein